MADLFPFQQDAVSKLLDGKHIVVAAPGVGKTPISLVWANRTQQRTHKRKLVVWTTAAKSATSDFEDEADKFAPELRSSLDSFEVVSWHKARKWLMTKTTQEMSEYIFIADELHLAKHGYSSLRGRAFLTFTKHTDAWAGFTATPGDYWIDFYPYFQATHKIKNKTEFQSRFCIMQRQPFPKILRYINEPLLTEWWREISYVPDDSTVMSQLPPDNHQVITLPPPKGYKKVLKTSTTLEGEFLENNMALLHYLRQLCATPDKLSYIEDYLNSLSSSSVVIFYNYTCEREQLMTLAKSMHRKIWRIDGECHEIPTADTIGANDIVLCHYLSGSEALNLQFINRWVSYSYNYSYSTSVQARGRIRRVGQSRPQFYTYLETKGTIEQEIKKALHNKSDFAADLWRAEKET